MEEQRIEIQKKKQEIINLEASLSICRHIWQAKTARLVITV